MCVKVDVVFSGGGVKAFAFLGALEALKEKGITIERAAGSSAGALIAGLCAAGYSIDELNDIVHDLDLKELLDSDKLEKYFPFIKWLALYRSFGLYKGHAFEKWLEQLLNKKGVYTFGDIKEGTLKLTVADLTLGRLVILPDDLTPLYGILPERFSVAKAIRMSAGLPFFFRPEVIYNQEAKKHVMVDGALISSLPIWLFKKPDEKPKRPVIGFQLQSKEKYFTNFPIGNGIQFGKTLIATMQHAQDLRYISKYDESNIVFLDTDHVNVADFSLSEKDRDQLAFVGQKSTLEFINKRMT